jgi:U-box domain
MEHLEKVGDFDPLTRQPLRSVDLVPNLSLKACVEDFMPRFSQMTQECVGSRLLNSERTVVESVKYSVLLLLLSECASLFTLAVNIVPQFKAISDEQQLIADHYMVIFNIFKPASL